MPVFSRLRFFRIFLSFFTVLLCCAPSSASAGAEKGPPSPTDMGSCGTLNSVETSYETRAECAARGGIFLVGVRPYPNMYVVDACTHVATNEQAQLTFAVFRAAAADVPALENLLAQHVAVLRSHGLISTRPVVTLRSNDDPGVLVQMLEWLPGGADAAHANTQVQQIWSALSQVSQFLRLGQAPEATCKFATFKIEATQ